MDYETMQNDGQEVQEVQPKRRNKRNQRREKQKRGKEKKQLQLWVKIIGCVLIPYLFILLMGIVNTYAVPVNVAFVLSGSIVLLLGMIIYTIISTKRKKV